MMERIEEVSPLLKARIAGALYLFTIVAGLSAVLLLHGRLAVAVNLVGGIAYMGGDASPLLHLQTGESEPLAHRGRLQSRGIRYGSSGVETSGGGQSCLLRSVLPPARIPHLQVNVPAPVLGCAADICRGELADLPVAATRKTDVSLQSDTRPHRGRGAYRLAARGGRKRHAVERASLRWSPCRVVKGPVHKSILGGKKDRDYRKERRPGVG